MDGYLGEFSVELKDTPFARFTSADWALHFIERYGGIDGDHHKQGGGYEVTIVETYKES